jgi:dTDP-glucose 4,6-dehydratase
MNRRVLVTGGMGFIGSNFIHYWLDRHPKDVLVNYDLVTYAGNPANHERTASNPRYLFVRGDISDGKLVRQVLREEGITTIVHFAAESHVDRSIEDPGVFVRTNVLGTQVLLEAAREHGIQQFVHVSTDEVYGSLGETGYFTEQTPLSPNSPYSASKAGSDLLARAYFHTFGMPVMITRCSNNYGPYQHPEKLIPLAITNAISDRPIPLYGSGLHIRDWLYVQDHCSAIECVIERGVSGEVYNVGGHNEHTNVDVLRRILAELGKPLSLITPVKDRPGHDARYAIDSSKIVRELQWQPSKTFDQGLRDTVDWYQANSAWWLPILKNKHQTSQDGKEGGAG